MTQKKLGLFSSIGIKSHNLMICLAATTKRNARLSIQNFLSFLCTALLIFAASPSGANPSDASSEPYIGLSAFAAMNPSFPCDSWLRTTRGLNKPAMAVLWGTFGNSGACMERFLYQNRNRPHLLEIHFSNQTCLEVEDGRRCEDGELLRFNERRQPANTQDFNQEVLQNPALQNRIRDRIRRINQWLITHKNSNTKAVVSLGLEDEYSLEAFEKIVNLFQEVNRETPLDFETVRSPEIYEYSLEAARFAGYTGYLELHPGSPTETPDLSQYPIWTPPDGQPPAKPTYCITNLDGVSTPRDGGVSKSVSFEQAKGFITRHHDCMAVFLWHAPLQGLQPVLGPRPGDGAYRPTNAVPREREFTIDSGLIRRFNCAMRTWRNDSRC
ncbi:hypothetical protein H6G00_21865 [Leptolyngbya sp. FACHB-541]|uniref:hypothetical protein n=1 Tax=Leptolyngbya sp. FACHB-541 TaxID=2692810 RepID=UPI0016866D52|nr:hypothetical protein [Leptolyngbya sp. FACHB-541]MBD1999228.1 hypothetical protein [Leptolyngbya sp. FACHB-541]